MSPITLIIVIALGVAIGISAAPYLGTAVAIAGGALLVAIAALLAFFILRSSVQQGISFVEKIKEGVRIYFF
jgi:arginine exporter protein ArgO